MKTIKEVKDTIAKRHGYFDWSQLTVKSEEQYNKLIDEAMQEYAKQCCEEQKIQCSNDVQIFNECDDPSYKTAEESILSTPNVAEKP